jgi:S1-C subfamily serine protease
MKDRRLSVFVVLLLVGSLGMVVSAMQQLQDMRQRASELPQGTSQQPPTTVAPPQMQTLSSPKYGYTVQINPEYWATKENTSGATNVDQVIFVLRAAYGVGAVNFSATESTAGEQVEKIFTRMTGIDASAITKKETVTKNGKTMNRFIVTKRILDEQISTTSYIFNNGTHYYALTTIIQDENKLSLTDKLIDDIIRTNTSAGVQGVADVTTDMPLSESRIAELVNPSVVQIVNHSCIAINPHIDPVINATLSATPIQYMKDKYTYCTGGEGSGFLLSKDGYIATNGHVASIPKLETFAMMLLIGDDPSILRLFADVYRQEYLRYDGTIITEEEAKEAMDPIKGSYYAYAWTFGKITKYLGAGKIDLTVDKATYFIKLADHPFPIDPYMTKEKDDPLKEVHETKDIKEATFIGKDFPDNDTMDVIKGNQPEKSGADVAVLKITHPDNLKFPGLPIGNTENLESGGTLLIVGYPGLVQGSASSSSLLNFSSSAKPSVTRGIISSIKGDQDGRKLIQTDASIASGNSGGPAIDENATAIGIATYSSISLSGQYNFVRSIDELNNLMKKNSIVIGNNDVFDEWKLGMAYYWNGYYKKALPHLESVKQSYPIHTSIDKYIKNAKQSIAQGKDKETWWEQLTDVIPAKILFGIAAIMLLIGVIGILRIIIVHRRGTNVTPPFVPPTPSLYQTTSVGPAVTPGAQPVVQKPIVNPTIVHNSVEFIKQIITSFRS